MSLTEDVANKLAVDVLRQMSETGDEDLAREVAKVLESTSVPTQEAFNAAIRVFGADQRARSLMAARLKAKA